MKKENFVENFENLFGGQYLERGKDYYKEGLVKNLLRDQNLVTANVEGNNIYRVTVDLKTKDMNCTCPCDFNCKHMAAVLYSLRANKAQDTEKLFAPLKKKSREELEEIIKKMVLENPEQAIFVNPDDSSIKKEIRQLWLTSDEYGFELKVRRLYNLVAKKEKPLKLELQLFNKLFDIYDHFGGDMQVIEEIMFKLLKEINKELKKPKNKAKRKETLKRIKTRIGKYYDWLLDALE